MTNAQILKRSAAVERLMPWFGSGRRLSLSWTQKKDPKTICQVLDIGRTVLTEWCRAFLAKGLAFFGLNDYSKREGHLTFEQEKALKKHFTDNPPSDTHVIRAYILAEYGQQFSISGATKLMKRMDFVYKKPIALAMQAD